MKALGLIVLVFVSACAGTSSDSSMGSEHRVLVGTGRDGYQPLDGEPTLGLVSGIQGGFHVWTSFVAYGFEADVLRMALTASVEGDEPALPVGGNMAVFPAVDANGEPVLSSWGWPAIVQNPRCSHAKRLRLDLVVTDELGHEAADTKFCWLELAEEYRETDCPP